MARPETTETVGLQFETVGNKIITVDRNDIELIAKIESLGTWEEEHWISDLHNSFDLYIWNGKVYKIFKDSERADSEPEAM